MIGSKKAINQAIVRAQIFYTIAISNRHEVADGQGEIYQTAGADLVSAAAVAWPDVRPEDVLQVVVDGD